MAVTLLINTGSSSKKYALFNEGREVMTVHFEHINDAVEVCTVVRREQQHCETVGNDEYRASLRRVINAAMAYKVIKLPADITSVGVRVVAPGAYFTEHRLVTDEYIRTLRSTEAKAPLHIPPTLYELEQVRIELPGVCTVAVSDSAFHSTMPAHNRTYSIATKDSERFDIQRFGYHGVSLASVVRQFTTFLPRHERVVVCHVGSGISLTAVLRGESVDTTMGYSPGSGMIMGTRAGDIEPGALLELMRAKTMSVPDAYRYLHTECGLKGLTGEADIRHLLEQVAQEDGVAKAAFQVFISRFQKLLAGMVASLGGVDAVVFTATAVERSSVLRASLLEGMSWLGLRVAESLNDQIVGGSGVISPADADVTIAVIHNNETAEMMREVGCFK